MDQLGCDIKEIEGLLTVLPHLLECIGAQLPEVQVYVSKLIIYHLSQ